MADQDYNDDEDEFVNEMVTGVIKDIVHVKATTTTRKLSLLHPTDWHSCNQYHREAMRVLRKIYPRMNFTCFTRETLKRGDFGRQPEYPTHFEAVINVKNNTK